MTPVYYRNPDATLGMIEVETDDLAVAQRMVKNHLGGPDHKGAVMALWRTPPPPAEFLEPGAGI